jgi:hypothetical protein
LSARILYFGLNIEQDNFLSTPHASQAEDVYEENDIRTSAYDLSAYENVWLSSIGGLGVQKDDDWFEIYITSGYQRLVVDLLFSDVEGDIDISVYDNVGTYVTGSASITDNEFIDYTLPSSGTYYLRIYHGDAGNTYDMLWDDIYTTQTDDAYEENDLRTSAEDISGNERSWLSSNNGLGISSDQDWYQISNSFDALRLVILCYFSDAAGDIGLALYDSSGTLLYWVNSAYDHERLEYITSTGGTYYVLVYATGESYSGNTYDLWWDDLPGGDDRYEENDVYTTAYDLSAYENTWLSGMTYGLGVQSDYDFYEIYLSPGEELLSVSLSFSHAAGNIDLAVYDSEGTFLTYVASTTDNEYIDLLLATSGTYYLRVYGANAGNLYDLWWDDFTPPSDDAYEVNNGYSTAYDLSLDEQDWLTEISGAGIQANDDWYEIYITPGYENLILNCTFSDLAGDINVQIYASDGTTLVAYSWSTSDNEYIDTILPSSGTYYIRVYGHNAGNLYNLWWDDLIRPSDDNYEENDADTTAYDLTANENIWLSTIDGNGIQYDDDWYEIYVDAGNENVYIELLFSHALGNIDLELINSSLSLIAASTSATDNEYIDVIVPSEGTYYIYIEGNNAGNTYDLMWEASAPIVDDAYEENDDDTHAYDLTSHLNTWLSAISGLGVQADFDYYKVSITTIDQKIIVDLTYTYSEGALVLILTDNSLNPLATSNTTVDNEHIEYIIDATGNYYILVSGLDLGNEYNLKYNLVAVTDATPFINGYNIIYLIAIASGISIILIRKNAKKKSKL